MCDETVSVKLDDLANLLAHYHDEVRSHPQPDRRHWTYPLLAESCGRLDAALRRAGSERVSLAAASELIVGDSFHWIGYEHTLVRVIRPDIVEDGRHHRLVATDSYLGRMTWLLPNEDTVRRIHKVRSDDTAPKMMNRPPAP